MDRTENNIMEEEAVAAASETPAKTKEELVYLPIEKLYPHPDNPRKELGDLTELADNIRQTQKILQNLVVVEWPDETTGEMSYRIIAGHRRRAAAEMAGMTELPCVIVDLTPEEQIEAMMNENVHRKSLNIIEQANGFQLMLQNVGSVEEVSRRTGFSRTTVSNRIKYNLLDQDKLADVCSSRQVSFTDLNRLNEVDDIKDRNELLGKIGTYNFDYALDRVLSKQKAKKIKAQIKPLLRKMGYKPKTCCRSYWGTRDADIKNKLDIDEYTEEAVLKFIKDHGYPDGEQIYYHVFDNDGETYLFTALPEPTPQEKAKEAEEEALKAKKEALAEKFFELERSAYQCRRSFVVGCNATAIKRNPKALAALATSGITSDYNFNDRLFGEMLGLKASDNEHITPQMIDEKVSAMPEKAMLIYAYLRFEDSEKKNYRDFNLTYKVKDRFEKLYNALTALGYTLSDDEKALRDGSHELYAEAASLVKADSNDTGDDGSDEEEYDDEYDEEYGEYEDDYEEDEQDMYDFPFGNNGVDDDEDEDELLAS